MEGRFNHAGHPMLYLAKAENTAVAEMDPGREVLHIAALEFDMTAKVLDISLSSDIDGVSQEVIQCVARSSLCAAPRVSEGWDRPEYVFSRFVADCARHADFQAIRYGSVKDTAGVNLVLLEPSKEFAQVRLAGVKVVSSLGHMK
jgi:RES domain-containing protein